MRVVTSVLAFVVTVGLTTSAHAQGVPLLTPVLRIAMERTAVKRPYAPGNGVTWPVDILQVKPKYTPEAMRAKIEGAVELKMVILADGSVGDVTIVKSLDAQSGLDAAAIGAAKKWRFKPGMKDGQPVATIVLMSLEFRLHK